LEPPFDYPMSVITKPADTEWIGPYCAITDELAVDGVCPTHGPDDPNLVMHPADWVPTPPASMSSSDPNATTI
jgi:hypothetical protein